MATMKGKFDELGLAVFLFVLLVIVVVPTVIRGLVTSEIGCRELCRWTWKRDWDGFLSRVLVIEEIL